MALSAASGTLISAAAGSWGNSGSNGGNVVLTADSQVLTGNITADNISTLVLTLRNGSTLTGAINAEKTAKSVSLTLDTNSTWTLTADSYLTSLTGVVIAGSNVTNITGNGHNVYYDASQGANSPLGGLTYSLVNGGQLLPIK